MFYGDPTMVLLRFTASCVFYGPVYMPQLGLFLGLTFSNIS